MFGLREPECQLTVICGCGYRYAYDDLLNVDHHKKPGKRRAKCKRRDIKIRLVIFTKRELDRVLLDRTITPTLRDGNWPLIEYRPRLDSPAGVS